MQLDFILSGFAKCGTTTLQALLAEHPEICMSRVKEPRFFSKEKYEKEWSLYKSLFEKSSKEVLCGEASVRYTEAEFEVISRERILKHFPNIKLIFIARDPICRIESLFREFHHSGYILGVSCPFDIGDALNKFPNFVEDTRYLQRLDNYRNHLPEENIHVLFLEEFEKDTKRELQKIYRFLGVDDTYESTIPNLIRNKGSTKYRDTALFRTIKQNSYDGEKGFTLRHLQYQERQKIWRRNGWRVPFGSDPVIWPEEPWRFLGEQFAQESIEFLQKYNKPLSLWPSLQ